MRGGRAEPVVTGRRICKGSCGRWRHVIDFPSRTKGDNCIIEGTCWACKKQRERERYQSNPEPKRAAARVYRSSDQGRAKMIERRSTERFKERTRAYRRRQYKLDPEKHRRQSRERHRRLWETSPEYREKVRQQKRDWDRRQRERAQEIAVAKERALSKKRKGNMRSSNSRRDKWLRTLEAGWALKAQATPEQVEYLELGAPVPVEVMRRFLTPILVRGAAFSLEPVVSWDPPMNAEGDLIGIKEASMWKGVPERTINRIYKDPNCYSVGVGLADQLALEEDFHLDEILDAAREWAAANDNPWPFGYRGVNTEFKRMMESGNL